MAVVEDRDLGYTRIVSGMKELDGAAVVVGVLRNAGKADDNKTDLVDVAVYNEYGTRDIPSRPFLRIATDVNGDDWQKLAEDLIIRGVSRSRVLNVVGLQAVGDIQEVFGSEKLKPNAPATVARKGSAAPLIDTGRLRQSIHYRVED